MPLSNKPLHCHPGPLGLLYCSNKHHHLQALSLPTAGALFAAPQELQHSETSAWLPRPGPSHYHIAMPDSPNSAGSGADKERPERESSSALRAFCSLACMHGVRYASQVIFGPFRHASTRIPQRQHVTQQKWSQKLLQVTLSDDGCTTDTIPHT